MALGSHCTHYGQKIGVGFPGPMTMGLGGGCGGDLMSGILESGVRETPYKDRADAALAAV